MRRKTPRALDCFLESSSASSQFLSCRPSSSSSSQFSSSSPHHASSSGSPVGGTTPGMPAYLFSHAARKTRVGACARERASDARSRETACVCVRGTHASGTDAHGGVGRATRQGWQRRNRADHRRWPLRVFRRGTTTTPRGAPGLSQCCRQSERNERDSGTTPCGREMMTNLEKWTERSEE